MGNNHAREREDADVDALIDKSPRMEDLNKLLFALLENRRRETAILLGREAGLVH